MSNGTMIVEANRDGVNTRRVPNPIPHSIGEWFEYSAGASTWDEFFKIFAANYEDAEYRHWHLLEVLVGYEEWLLIARNHDVPLSMRVWDVPIRQVLGYPHLLLFRHGQK